MSKYYTQKELKEKLGVESKDGICTFTAMLRMLNLDIEKNDKHREFAKKLFIELYNKRNIGIDAIKHIDLVNQLIYKMYGIIDYIDSVNYNDISHFPAIMIIHPYGGNVVGHVVNIVDVKGDIVYYKDNSWQEDAYGRKMDTIYWMCMLQGIKNDIISYVDFKKVATDIFGKDYIKTHINMKDTKETRAFNIKTFTKYFSQYNCEIEFYQTNGKKLDYKLLDAKIIKPTNNFEYSLKSAAAYYIDKLENSKTINEYLYDLLFNFDDTCQKVTLHWMKLTPSEYNNSRIIWDNKRKLFWSKTMKGKLAIKRAERLLENAVKQVKQKRTNK